MIKLKPTSWKIMLEVLIKGNPTKVQEVPIQFDERHAGESKFNSKQMVAYVKHLALLFIHKHKRFVKFCAVGGSGTLLHLGIVWTLTESAGLWYMTSVIIAVAIVVTWNFTFNSLWTFAQQKDPNDGDYDWNGFYKGNPIQRWWKRSITNVIWKWIPNSSILLDIACGSSPTITRYSHAIGIDMNEAKLDFMRNKIPNGFFTNMLSDNLDFDDANFDYVLCIELLEHLEEPRKTIAEIARVLKIGGKAIIATPDYNRKWWLLAEMFIPARDQHITRFSRKKLEDMCKDYGLIPLKHKYVAGCDLVELFSKEAL